MLELNKAYCMDCMQGMAEFPDGFFDLAVVDPPYGDAGGGAAYRGSSRTRFGGLFKKYHGGVSRTGGGWAARCDPNKKIIGWDHAPQPEYFEELMRVSRNQIIWGGNYFALPPTRCFLIWKKNNVPENFTMAMAEYAWTSFNANAKVFDHTAVGAPGERIHPTQKPVALYDWIFKNYAKPGFKILDTHLGSGSSRIAAYNAGLDFIGFEIDRDYFDAQEKRFADATAQIDFFHL